VILRPVLLGGLVGCAPSAPEDGDTDVAGDTDDTDDTDDTEEVPETDDTDPVAGCTLGTGVDAFVALDPTARTEVPVVRGLQGLWHVVGAVRCTGVYPGSPAVLEGDPVDTWPVLSWTIRTPEDALLGGYELLPRPMYPLGPGANLLDELLVLFTDTYADALDRDATMVLRLTDVDGVSVDASAPLRLVPEPGWTPPDTGDTLPGP
jgi:hypothetical protein